VKAPSCWLGTALTSCPGLRRVTSIDHGDSACGCMRRVAGALKAAKGAQRGHRSASEDALASLLLCASATARGYSRPAFSGGWFGTSGPREWLGFLAIARLRAIGAVGGWRHGRQEIAGRPDPTKSAGSHGGQGWPPAPCS
jgi:hypothetical protein